MFLLASLCSIVLLSSGFAWKMPSSYPIIASHDGHHFITTDSQPFIWQADTAWLLFVRLNMTEVEEYLDDRASKGFNMILTVGITQLG